MRGANRFQQRHIAVDVGERAALIVEQEGRQEDYAFRFAEMQNPELRLGASVAVAAPHEAVVIIRLQCPAGIGNIDGSTCKLEHSHESRRSFCLPWGSRSRCLLCQGAPRSLELVFDSMVQAEAFHDCVQQLVVLHAGDASGASSASDASDAYDASRSAPCRGFVGAAALERAVAPPSLPPSVRPEWCAAPTSGPGTFVLPAFGGAPMPAEDLDGPQRTCKQRRTGSTQACRGGA